jgi:hypothetical protein
MHTAWSITETTWEERRSRSVLWSRVQLPLRVLIGSDTGILEVEKGDRFKDLEMVVVERLI